MQKIVFIDLDKYLEFIREWIKLLQSVYSSIRCFIVTSQREVYDAIENNSFMECFIYYNAVHYEFLL